LLTIFSIFKDAIVTGIFGSCFKKSNIIELQDDRDAFGFERMSEPYSMSSSLGPGALVEEMKYMHGASREEIKNYQPEFATLIIPTSASPRHPTTKVNVAFPALDRLM